MSNKRFGRREPIRTSVSCPCGETAKLIKRRNFPFGRNSKSITSQAYKCSSCKREIPLTKKREVK